MAPFQFSIWFAIRYVLCMRNFSTFFFSSKFWKISLSMVFRFFRRLCCFCCYNLQLILLNFRLNNSSFQFGKTSATNYQFRAHCTWWTCLTIMLAEDFCFFLFFMSNFCCCHNLLVRINWNATAFAGYKNEKKKKIHLGLQFYRSFFMIIYYEFCDENVDLIRLCVYNVHRTMHITLIKRI